MNACANIYGYMRFGKDGAATMNLKEKMQFHAADAALGQILKYIDKDPIGNLTKLVNVSEKLAGSTFPKVNFEKFRQALSTPGHVWVEYALSIIRDTDRDALQKAIMAMGYGTYVATKTVRENRE